MAPHKVHGTHVLIYIKYKQCAFRKRENINIMETNNFKTYECFGLFKNENGKVHIVFGNFLVSSKSFDDFESAKKYINKKPWELIVNVTNALKMFNNEDKKENQNG